MSKNLIAKGLGNGLNLSNLPDLTVANEMLQMTGGLTLTQILKEEDELDKLKERMSLLEISYRDAQKTINRCIEEGKALRQKIDNYPKPQMLKNTEGAFMRVGRFVAEVVKQLNVNQNMNETQIDFAAQDILGTYGDKITIRELAWVFRRGIQGNYGKTDFKIDVQTFHQWIQKYLSDKNERIAQKQEVKAKEAEATTERRDIILRLSR